MDALALFFQTFSTIIMVVGVIFSVISLRNFQAGRKRESAILLLNSFQTSEFVKGLLLILDLPDHVDQEAIKKLSYDQFITLYMVVGTWERLGILVFRREIEFSLVEDAYSGPIVQSWQKLDAYILAFRAQLGRDTAFEWFQWLAERMIEKEKVAKVAPAYVAHRHWKI